GPMVRTVCLVDFLGQLPSFRSDRNYKRPPARSVDSAHETTAPLRAAARLPLRRGQLLLRQFRRRDDRQILPTSNSAATRWQALPTMNGAEGMIVAPNLRACFLALWLGAKHPYPRRSGTSGTDSKK